MQYLFRIHVVLACFTAHSAVFASTDTFITQAAAAAEEVDQMRRNLVKGVPEKVTAATFKAVCKPVGMRAKQIADDKKWLFRQASHKNRNPNHAANETELEAIRRFQKDRSLTSIWLQEQGRNHYFRRITVQKACLACHGSKSARPVFVQKKYPADRAFDFKAGDLRGVYHITEK